MLGAGGHMRQILEADLDYPVILDHDDSIMDGGHSGGFGGVDCVATS